MTTIEDLPYDVFNYMLEVGNVCRKDIINLYKSKICFYKNKDRKFNLLFRDFGIKGDFNLYLEMNNIFNKNFRKDRASILLIDIKITGNDINYMVKNKYPNYEKYLRRGDIIENIDLSGHKTNGVFMFNGVKIIDLNYDYYGNGYPSKEFLVFKDFNPDYWNKGSFTYFLNVINELNINDIYCPKQSSKFYWYTNPPPLLLDKNSINMEESKKDVKNNQYYFTKYLIKEFESKKYKIQLIGTSDNYKLGNYYVSDGDGSLDCLCDLN